MATSFVLARPPPPQTRSRPAARSPVYWHLPARRPWIGPAFFTVKPVVYDSSGIDKCRFYRHTSSTLLVLVLGTNRSTAVGYKALGEPWETASGVFALPSTRRHPEEKNVCLQKTASVWTDFSTASQSDLTTAMNLALNQSGYTQEDGSVIT